MISTESLTTEWIDAVSKELKYPDKGLLEKAIRALSLLELLVKQSVSGQSSSLISFRSAAGSSTFPQADRASRITSPATYFNDVLALIIRLQI